MRCPTSPTRTVTSRAVLAALALALLASVAAPFAAGVTAGNARAASPSGKRVGLQVGHLRIHELPEDQARLRAQTGGSGGGYREVDINLAVVERAAALLHAQGVTVDVLPATVPRGYRADAFVSVHCDANPGGESSVRGYKLARYRASTIADEDDALIAAISASYGAATGLPLDANVTRAMTGYYAYNPKRYKTVIDARTPSAIIELGFLTNPADRAVLVTRQDLIAEALVEGIMRFLGLPPTPAAPAVAAVPTVPTVAAVAAVAAAPAVPAAPATAVAPVVLAVPSAVAAPPVVAVPTATSAPAVVAVPAASPIAVEPAPVDCRPARFREMDDC